MKLKKTSKQLENSSKYKCKSDRGVTIVALVITIIVMLILAGTTINLTMKGDGIFATAKEAEEKHKISEYIDKIELARGSVALENLGEVTLDNLIAQIYEEKIVPQNSITKLDEERAKITTQEGYVFIITAKGTEYEGKGEEYDTPPEIQQGDITFGINPDGWTNGNVEIEISKNTEDSFTLKYSYDAINWSNYTNKLTVEENTNVYACLENKLGEKSNASSYVITKIDKIDPIDFTPSITSTTNSITVDASGAKDGEATTKYGQSGIKEIWYSNDAGTTWETNEEDKANTKYTFKELIQGKEYEVQVKVIDNAGNQIITKAQTITTTSVTGLTVTVGDADTWTNGTKTITITAKNSNYSTIRYTTNGTTPTTSSTAYTGAFTVSSNCTITALAFDSTNQVGASATKTVTKIDTTVPEMVSITKSAVSWSGATGTVTITGKAKDVNSGIIAYQFSTNSGLTASSTGWTTITATTAETTQTKSVTSGGTYYFYVKDQAGNINKNSVAVTISDTTKPTISLTANTTSNANSVTLTGTSKDTGSGLVGYGWTTANTQPTSWTAVTQTTSQISKTKTITANATHYFWTKDGKGNVNVASLKVTNIVSKVSITAYTGVTVSVGSTATPALTFTGTAKSKSFSSSKTSVATINASTGLVTAKAAGTATMTVTLTNYDGTTAKKTCTVTVTQPVTGITLSQTSASLTVGGTLALTATIAPTNASNKNVTWSSTNTSVATVSGGKVTAKAAGTATIKATAQDGSGKSASCTVTVKNTTLTSKIQPSDYGKSINYSVTVSGTTLNNWQVFYYDGSNVYIILSGYLPHSLIPSSVSVSGKYNTYNVTWSDYSTGVNDLKSTSKWSAFAAGVAGATATGAPTEDMFMKSYEQVNGNVLTSGTYYSGIKGSPYRPYSSAQSGCYGYWLATSTDNYTMMVVQSVSQEFNKGYTFDQNFGLRPVVKLPASTTGRVDTSVIID